MTSIIIVCWNNLEFTQQCLESIEAFTPEKHEIIFIDNGSTDDTMKWLMDVLSKHPNYKFIKNDKNLGAVIATNQGIEIAKGDYLVFLNNDTVVSKEWLKGLIDCVNSSPDVGMVAPRSNCVSGPQIVTDHHGYDTIMKYVSFAENFRKSFKGCYIPYWRVIPFCGLIKKSVLEKIGRFDERYFPGNFADDDMCRRLVLSGYRNLICGDVFIHHHGSKSFTGIDYAKNIEDCQKLFDEKWKDFGKTVSAVLIVKDESMSIGKCLSSIYPFVDEIVVVDTGSTDRTKAIAADCGPKVHVYDFEWIDDFSAARNFANSKATKDWILSADADEDFEGLDKLKDILKPFHAYRIETRNYTTNPLFTGVTFNMEGESRAAGIGWFPSTKIRVWPRDERIYFEYPVHEVVENSVYHLGMGIVECKEIIVHHYGRMDEEYDDKHGEKYYHLLQKNYESGKNDLRSVEQLAIQAQGLKKFEDAKKFWQEVIKIDPTGSLAPHNLCHLYANEGDWQTAKSWAEKAFKLAPESKDVMNNLAWCEYHAGDHYVAEKLCRDALKKFQYNPITEGLLNAILTQREANNVNESLRGAGG